MSSAFSPKNAQTETPIRPKIESGMRIGSNKRVDLKVGGLDGQNGRSWIKVNDSKELKLDDPKDLKLIFSKSLK